MNFIALCTKATFVLCAFGLSSVHASGRFDHTAFDGLLRTYVKDGRVDYRGLLENAADRSKFDDYLTTLETSDPDTLADDTERLAFWIDAYNAFTIELILDHYPIESIRKIENPWGRKFFSIHGHFYSLDDVEHEIIRKRFREPRIHFALVCAAVGCPILESRAYTGERLEEMLDRAARRFLSDVRSTCVDHEKRVLYLSRIFEWYGEDFEKYGSYRAFVERHLPDADRERMKGRKYKVEFLQYNWTLNDVNKE